MRGKKSNLPNIKNVIFSHWIFGSSSMNVMHKHAIPAQNIVEKRIHFLPTHIMTKIAIAIAGISTRPARACWRKNYPNKSNLINFCRKPKENWRWLKELGLYLESGGIAERNLGHLDFRYSQWFAYISSMRFDGLLFISFIKYSMKEMLVIWERCWPYERNTRPSMKNQENLTNIPGSSQKIK